MKKTLLRGLHAAFDLNAAMESALDHLVEGARTPFLVCGLTAGWFGILYHMW